MSYFEKIRAFFQRKKRTNKSGAGMVNVILSMPQCIVHPADLMQSLGMAMAYVLREGVYFSVSDIKLFELRDRETKAFLGSCYAMCYKGLYYANVIGGTEVFSCESDAFDFKPTEELLAPVYSEKPILYALRCHLNHKTGQLKVLELIKRNVETMEDDILHRFEEKISFDKAIETAQKIIGV